jgi:predicted N-acetyltransferase YhbS
MPLRIVNETDMTAALDARIRRLLCICFPKCVDTFCKTRAWHGSGPAFTVIAEDDAGELIAHVGVVDRTVAVDAGPLRVAGVQNVAVAPERRGQGWSDRALALAMSEAGKRGFDAGLLFCGRGVMKVYDRCGWRCVGEAEIVRTSLGKEPIVVRMPARDAIMFFALRASEFPQGRIDLRGDDW